MKQLVNGIILAGIALMLTGFMQSSGKPIAAPTIPHHKAAVSSASYSKPTPTSPTVSAAAVTENNTASDTSEQQNTNVAQSSHTPYSGSHEDMMAAAGINPSDYWAAEWTISAESGWNPYAREPNTGACGLAQELPCGKSGCSLGNEICELTWMNQYIMARYGSWSAEVIFHKINNWY